MDYLIVFAGGVLLGAGLTVGWAFKRKIDAVGQLRKELRLPPGCSPPVQNPYEQGEKERAKYRTMWGPEGDAQGR